jgi:hypothetical protein
MMYEGSMNRSEFLGDWTWTVEFKCESPGDFGDHLAQALQDASWEVAHRAGPIQQQILGVYAEPVDQSENLWVVDVTISTDTDLDEYV